MRGAKADCVYGATGTYKTSQIGKAALWVLKKYGKRTLLVSADLGGWEPIQPLVDEGIVYPWPIRLHKNPLESMFQATQGYWPENDEVDNPDAKLVKFTPDEFAEYGLIAFEGLTSFGDYAMWALRKVGASLSQDPNYKFIEPGGTMSFNGSNMSYYGFVQDRIMDYLGNSNMLPVEKVLWTALEARGEEEATKLPIIGPAIVGKKATGKIGQCVGNLLHMEAGISFGAEDTTTKQLSTKTIVKMYLQPHAEASSKLMFPAKVRAPFQLANEIPESIEPDIAVLYDKLEALKDKARKLVSVPKPAPVPVGVAK